MHGAERNSTARERLVVLIVEDNARMRAFIRSLLDGIATAVHECEDAATALRLSAEVQPDAVLMDIALGPNSADGIAATRLIHAAHPLVRIVMVTENSGPQYRAAATAAGASGFVGKDSLLELPAMLGSQRPVSLA